MRRLLWMMGMFKIPMIAYVRPKLLLLDDHKVQLRIRLRRRTKNHLKSMYFGSLAVGADVAAGLHAFYFAEQSDAKLSFAFKSVKAEFHQRATTDVLFESNEGVVIQKVISAAIESKERKNHPVMVYAYNTSKELVATFIMEISVKVK